MTRRSFKAHVVTTPAGGGGSKRASSSSGGSTARGSFELALGSVAALVDMHGRRIEVRARLRLHDDREVADDGQRHRLPLALLIGMHCYASASLGVGAKLPCT